ncbi:hypothetical protein D3C72_2476520 [compost metagenome]
MFRFEAAPAALNFILEAAQCRFVLRLKQMAGFTHRLQPSRDLNTFVLVFRIVRNIRCALFHLI